MNTRPSLLRDYCIMDLMSKNPLTLFNECPADIIKIIKRYLLGRIETSTKKYPLEFYYEYL